MLFPSPSRAVTDPCPRPVQEHPLVPVGDAEQLGDVGRSNTFDVAEHDDLALGVRQGRQDLADPKGQTVGHQPVVDLVGPRHGR